MGKIQNSGKASLLMLILMSEARADVRTTTGSNFKNTMLLIGKTAVEIVSNDDADKVNYFKWTVWMSKEIVESRASKVVVPGIDDEKLEEILSYICTE